MNWCFVLSALFLTLPFTARPQQPAVLPMGTVPTQDARVTGGLEVQGDRARLLTNASVTAFDHTANVSLARGGEVLVCSTSEFHLLRSGAGASLLFGLDRGAMEIHSASQPQDVLLTPDIRFAVESPGQLNLSVRVTREGDTCVDNAGGAAPVLVLSDVFSSTSYRLLPGQHVLFEHGNLREVVDRERSPCGCPAAMTVMQMAATPATPTPPAPGQETQAAPTTPALAAEKHPFPEATSSDLAPVAPVPNSPQGEKGTQIATTFNYGEGKGPPPSTVPVPSASGAKTSDGVAGSSTQNAPAPPPSPPGAHDLAHAIGRFFHKLFHPKS